MAFESPLVKPLGRRIHFVEFHDTEWCPAFFREALQDILNQAWEFEEGQLAKRSAAKQVAGDLARLVERSQTNELIDMCSGGGGPVGVIAKTDALKKCTFTLTDLYPNLAAFERAAKGSDGRVKFITTPVNATSCTIGDGKKGYIRTMFASMHHMTPELLEGILLDSVAKGHVFAAFEATNRSPLAILSLTLPLILLSAISLFYAFSRLPLGLAIARAFFTCVVPIIPAILIADGFTSCLRTYSRDEFMEIVKRADPENKYEWIVNERLLEGVPIPLTSYVGMPKLQRAPPAASSSS